MEMIKTTIDSSLGMLNQFWHDKNSSPPTSGAGLQHGMPSDVHHVKNEYPSYPAYPSNTNDNGIPDTRAVHTSYLPQANNMGPAPQNMYANPPQYAYPNPEPYPGAARRQYQTPLQQQQPPHEPMTSGYIPSYPHQAPYGGSYPESSAAGPDFYQAPGSSTSWRQFTGNIVPSLESNTNEYLSSMSSASALMSMGNGMGSNSGSGVVTDSGSGTPDFSLRAAQGQNAASGENLMWPGMVFDPGPNMR